MRHRVGFRKLGRSTSHRLAMLRNMATALFEYERISTTLMKAKELRPFAEKLITLAKRDEGRLHARRLAARQIQDPKVLKKLFDTLAPRFAMRNGGYSRIYRLGTRKGDGAEVAILELLGSEYKPKEKPDPKAKAEEKGKDKDAKPAAEAKPKAQAKPKSDKPKAEKAKPAKKAKAKEAAAE